MISALVGSILGFENDAGLQHFDVVPSSGSHLHAVHALCRAKQRAAHLTSYLLSISKARVALHPSIHSVPQRLKGQAYTPPDNFGKAFHTIL